MNEKDIGATSTGAPVETPQQPVAPQATSSVAPLDATAAATPPHNRLQILLGILGVVILIAAGTGLWYWKSNHPNKPTPPGYGIYPISDQTDQDFVQPTLVEGSYIVVPDDNSTLGGKSTNPPANTNVNWQAPKELGDLKLVLANIQGNPQPPQDETIHYYGIGTHGSNQIIWADAPAVDPAGPNPYFFEKTDKGYVFMQLMSSPNIYRSKDNSGDFGISKIVVGIDNKTVYRGLYGPDKLTWSGLNMASSYSPAEQFDSFVKDTKNLVDTQFHKVATLSDGDLYLFQQDEGDGGVAGEKFYIRNYRLRLPSGFYTAYTITYDFISDDSIPAITWADGSQNKEVFKIDGSGGCGYPGRYVTPAKDISGDLKITGTTSSKLPIYEFTDVHNKTLKVYYELYNPGGNTADKISLTEWYKHHPLVVFKNGVGDYVLMVNESYAQAAECGKPVIYLYPTNPTKVSVKVGADVTVSEPTYNTGWKVLAQPNGTLTNSDGKTYDSLFWEGLGKGEYPQIKEGIVVAHDKLNSTISDQLTQLGLNAKESQDFKDFWMSRLPSTPYVRLTWFTTSQMDKLAPLYVSPRPDTVIRVFLDFQGLNEPVAMPVQHLSAIPRKGFTLIEWGGLLRK